MSVIIAAWDARSEAYTAGERVVPQPLDGRLCGFCGAPVPLDLSGTCSVTCRRNLSQHRWRARARASEDRAAHAHTCDLCHRRCHSCRYLCHRCAGDLGLVGTLAERKKGKSQ